jgi:regulator of cell morphogenesis and NO signaling
VRFDPKQEVASVVAAAPGTSRVFERHGIDFCCGGRMPLESACAKKGLDVARVLEELDAATATDDGAVEDWGSKPVGALIDHILARHHEYVRREIPRLTALMDRVLRVHGQAHPEIRAIARIWDRTGPGLGLHMQKEEQVLFPAARDLERSGGDPGFGLDGPIDVMEMEHEEHGGALATMREISGGFAVPPDACGSWRALYGGLDEFEKDLHVHVHLENNVLFPRLRDVALSGR